MVYPDTVSATEFMFPAWFKKLSLRNWPKTVLWVSSVLDILTETKANPLLMDTQTKSCKITTDSTAKHELMMQNHKSSEETSYIS